MKWTKFKVKTITEAEDIIISTLYDIGLEGAQIEDKVPLTAWEKEQMFVDILPDGPEDDGIAYLSFFVEETEDGSLMLNGEATTAELILEKVASMSCKAAVKGNHKLSLAEVDALITELLTLENPFNCPHGRPTIISMSKNEIEKKFKRIVS